MECLSIYKSKIFLHSSCYLVWHCINLTVLLDSRMNFLNSGKNRIKINSSHPIFTLSQVHQKFGWCGIVFREKKWLENFAMPHAHFKKNGWLNIFYWFIRATAAAWWICSIFALRQDFSTYLPKIKDHKSTFSLIIS